MGSSRFPDTNLGVLQALAEMVDKAQISYTDYYKGLVALSYEFILSNEYEKGLECLLIPPEQYYTEIQPKQIKEDPVYEDVVIRVGTWLKENESMVFLKPNVPFAQA